MKKNFTVLNLLFICGFAHTISAQTYWDFSGNSGTSTSFIGTTNSQPLRFRTANTERMSLTTTGALGLGTTTPGRRLHIHGTGSITSQPPLPTPPGTESMILITNTESGVGAWNGMRLGLVGSNAQIVANNTWLQLMNGSSYISLNQNGKIVLFAASGTYDAKMAMLPYGENGLFIDNSGLTSGYSLKVKTSSNAVQALTVYNGTTGKFVVKGDGQVGIGTVAPTSGYMLDVAGQFVVKGDGQVGIGTVAPTSGYMLDVAGKFVVNSNGQVGVGTVSPSTSYMLDVAGKIRSCEVKVTQTSWCDFVFAPDYKLLSLADLKEFIQENRHLPEMPSEADILENDGFEVSQMTQALLQRAEENTLYIIELEERIAKLEATIARLADDKK